MVRWARITQVAASLAVALRHGAGQRCQHCGAVLDQTCEAVLCEQCQALLEPRQGGYCPRCGICFADPLSPVYDCLACRTSPPPWSRLGFYASYAGPLRDLVHRYKFGHDHGVSHLLGIMLHWAWTRHELGVPDVLIPVPMRPRPLLLRGFNQSMELGRLLAQRIGCPVISDGLRKIRETKAQSSLGRVERVRNVDKAFAASTEMAGQHVLLVDDVMTTGATVTSCVKACLGAGACKVEVLVLARAL